MFAWIFETGVIAGWTSTVVIVSFLCGINLFMTGVVGLYVGSIHAEVKRRPLYVINRLFRAEFLMEFATGKYGDLQSEDVDALLWSFLPVEALMESGRT